VGPDEPLGAGAGRSVSDSPDRSFEDRYTHLTEIGRGGHSIVYRAYSPEFDREVAVKVFEGHVTDDEVRRRFRRECQVIGTFGDHPHVVSVFDSGFTAEGQPYLAMAYCAGGSFGQRLLGQGPRPPEEAAMVGVAVADALDAAHQRGFVHRDVKPQNVLLTGYGVVALADFGVAAGPAGDFRSFAATPGYVAPEVVLGDGGHGTMGGPEADVYSVGATLYALLTGGPPVRPDIGEPDDAYLRRCAEAPVPPLSGSAPPALSSVVLQCLNKEPHNRPSSAAVLRRSLRLAATQDGLELPERLDILPVPASFGPSRPRGRAAARKASAEPASPPRWSRRVAAACLAGGLIAAGVAAGVVLAPDAVELGGPFHAPGDGDTAVDPSGPSGQAPQQPDDPIGDDRGNGDDGSSGPGNQGSTAPAAPVGHSGSPPPVPGEVVSPPAATPTSEPTTVSPTPPAATTTPADPEDAEKEKKDKEKKKEKG
jgi:serine/threonine-protein kinase PknK